jgi:hypothetical protein
MSGILTASTGIIASSRAGPDTNLAFNNVNDGYWYTFPQAGSITLNLNSAGTITSDGDFADGPTAWYTGSPTGSNFEVRVTWTSEPAGGGASEVLVGPLDSQSAITLGNASAFYNLGSNILLTVNALSGTDDMPLFTVVIRQVSLPSNSISKIFELEWIAP